MAWASHFSRQAKSAVTPETQFHSFSIILDDLLLRMIVNDIIIIIIIIIISDTMIDNVDSANCATRAAIFPENVPKISHPYLATTPTR